MTKVRRTARPVATLTAFRATLGRVQREGERMAGRVRHDLEVMVGRLRNDVDGFMARSRREALKEVRELEARMLKVLHGATREHVARLERRIARLEEMVGEKAA